MDVGSCQLRLGRAAVVERRTRARYVGSLSALITILFLSVAVPASAADLIDIVIQAVDPTLQPYRPLVECLAGGGSATACVAEAAKHQAGSALPLGPGDDRIKKLVGVIEAARDGRWVDVVTLGGTVAAHSVACAVIPVQGPAKQPVCNIIGWVISNNVSVLDKAYRVLEGPDWWGAFELLGSGVCTFIPGDGAAGAAKNMLCGALGQILKGAKEMADKVAQGFVAGADALENLLFGDDSHMPYDTYYALYWQPWYQYATTLALKGQSLGPLSKKIWDPCVDYFDSHNQYRSTARKTCDDMRDKRFNPEVQGFARAMPVAVDGYFETIARPAVRAAVLASFGKSSSQDLPGQKLFAQNCVFQMRRRFQFPAPDDSRCKVLQDMGNKFKTFKPLFDQMAAGCFADIKTQNVEPTAWALACDGMESQYSKAFATESLRLMVQLGELKNKGCVAPGKKESAKIGLRVTCDSYAGYERCREIFQHDGKKYCVADVPPIPITVPRLPPSGEEQKTDLPPGTISVPRNAGRPPAGEGAPSGGAPRVARPAPVTVEAEALVAGGRSTVRGGQTSVQAMSSFGPGWSGRGQLFWAGGQQGSTLVLGLDVPQAGQWSIEVYLTRAPDYASLAFDVNQKPTGVRFDGYAPRVTGPVAVRLGPMSLEAGRQEVRVVITGRNRSSTGFLAGIDRIRLVPEGSR